MSNKHKIAYLITSNGADGRAPKSIDHAYWDEEERDKKFESLGSNKNYYTKGMEIVEVDDAKKKALAKLNGIDKLVLLHQEPQPIRFNPDQHG